jgi:hypothetical protein
MLLVEIRGLKMEQLFEWLLQERVMGSMIFSGELSTDKKEMTYAEQCNSTKND